MCAFADEVALELGHGAEHVEDEPGAGRGRVDRLVEAPEADAVVLERAGRCRSVPQAAPESVELPHDQRVAGAQVIERRCELRPLGERAAGAV